MRECVCLKDDTAAGCWVIVGADLVLVAVDKVDVRVTFPLVVHLSDGDQLDCLPLRERERKVSFNILGNTLIFVLSKSEVFRRISVSCLRVESGGRGQPSLA